MAVDRAGVEPGALASLRDLVAERREQLLQLVGAAVDVADDVERPVEVLLVVPERLALDLDAVDVLGLEHPDVAEALAPETLDRALEVQPLAAQDVRPELAVGPLPVALLADPLRDVEHDRDRQHVVLARERDERLPRVLLDVRGVDDRQPAGGEPLARRRSGATSNASPVADWSFSSSETSPRKKSDDMISVGLKCARANVDLPEPVVPDEDDERQLREVDLHRLKTAIWVGGTDLGVLGTDRQEAHRVAEAVADRGRPRRRTRRASTRTGGRGGGSGRPAGSRSGRCTRRSAWSRRRAPGGRTRRPRARAPAGGRARGAR